MRNFFKIGFISAFVLLFNIHSKADYIIASDLNYTCLGDLKYEVELTVYVECQSKLGVNLDVISTYGVSIKSVSKKVGTGVDNVVFNVTKTGSNNGQEINLFCLTQPTNCAGGVNRGVKKYTYKGQVDLKQYGGAADDWKFFWQQDFRTDEIPTLKDAQLEPYYVEAAFDNLNFSCNNSPKFNSDAVLKSFVNEETTIDLFAKETDGDELRYKIISPKAFENQDLIYANGASKDNPFGDGTSVSVNSTGQIKFNAKTANKRGLFDVEVSEYRGGKKIASVTRGVQISTFDNSNDAPVLFGFNGGDSFTKSYCVGDKIDIDKLTVKAIDPNKNRITMTSRASNKNFSFFQRINKGDTTVYTFYWPEFTSAYVGTHEFIITATDDACPTPKSTTQTYTIEVRENPQISLIPLDTIPCQPKTVLSPQILKGSGDFTYEWYTWDSVFVFDPVFAHVFKIKDTISTEPKYTTNVPDKYAVKITDAKGCKSNITLTELRSSFSPIMSVNPTCLGEKTKFENKTILFDAKPEKHELTKTIWTNGESLTPLLGDSIVYEYTKKGFYNVSMKFETNYDCKDTLYKEINVCEKKKFNIVVTDSCANNYRIVDSTSYIRGNNDCIPFNTTWIVNGLPYTDVVTDPFVLSKLDDKIPLKNGINNITYKVNYTEGCSKDTTLILNFYANPEAIITDKGKVLHEVLINCSHPDTTLKAKVINNGNGGLKYSWIINDSIPTGDTDLNFLAKEISKYTFRVTDKLGCVKDTSVSLINSTVAKFSYDTVCTLGNTMNFYDSTTTKTTRIKKYEWNFGDGSPISSLKNPTHIFDKSAIYPVILKVTDTLDCTSIETINVYNTTLSPNFKIDPNYRSITVCAQNPIYGSNVTIVGDTNRIDSIFWFPGDGRKLTFSNIAAGLDSTALKGLNVKFTYPDDAAYKITSEVYYNAHPGVHNHSCKVSFSDSITVLPEFDGHIVNFRKCANDSALFYFVRQTGDLDVGVRNYNWYIAKHNTIDTTNRFNPVIAPENLVFSSTDSAATHFFGEVTLGLDIYLVATDNNNCKSVIRGGADISKNSSITASIIDTCFGFDAILQMYSPNEMGLGTTDHYGVVSYDNDTLLYNPFQRLSENKLSAAPLNVTFPKEGRNPVKIFVERVTYDEFGYKNHCRTVIDTAVYNDPIPRVAFKWDSVCSGVAPVTFKNLSFAPDNQEIVSYMWDFGDGTPISTEKDPTHVFTKGGEFAVTLSAETRNCPASKTDTIYVLNQPKAHFYMDVEFPEAYTAIPFVDSSESVSDIVYQKYDFKDGVTAETNSFTSIIDHTYDEIKVYNVSYIIRTEEGCTDTTVVRTDLNVYLTIPTAFSPNGDGNNDKLNLIYKSIEELYEYTIYNRWGEVVFETKDLKQGWDGIYKGKAQEAGVYVVRVKALGAYDTQFDFKQNISLLR